MTAEHELLVSVLTPSYNQAAWLSDNLRSVARQSYPSIEHIVMDGGSTDGTLDILSTAGDSVRWRSEPDKGQSDAINKAFRESRGEIVGWINSDDAYFDRRVIADVVSCFVEHPDVDVVYGHCAQVTGNGALVQMLWAPPFDRRLLRTVDVISQPSAFLRRSALSDPMLDETFHFAMDYELWLRLDAASRGFHRIDRITAIDRLHAERKSSTIQDVMHSDLRRLSEMYGTVAPPEGDRLRSRFYVRQRLLGALLLPKVRARDVAFTAPEHMKRGAWRRQIASRRGNWPAGLK